MVRTDASHRCIAPRHTNDDDDDDVIVTCLQRCVAMHLIQGVRVYFVGLS